MARRVSCNPNCEIHTEPVSYQTRLRCATRRAEQQSIQPDSGDVNQADDNSSDSNDEGEEVDAKLQDSLDEVEQLCLRTLANKVDHNPTEDSVTRSLLDVRATVGRFLPHNQLDRLPRNFRQLDNRYKRAYLRIVRLPVCRDDCSLAPGDETVCEICCQRLFRLNKPVREFPVVPLAEVVRYLATGTDIHLSVLHYTPHYALDFGGVTRHCRSC